MSFESEVRGAIDKRISAYSEGLETADYLDKSVLYILIGTMQQLKKELKL